MSNVCSSRCRSSSHAGLVLLIAGLVNAACEIDADNGFGAGNSGVSTSAGSTAGLTTAAGTASTSDGTSASGTTGVASTDSATGTGTGAATDTTTSTASSTTASTSDTSTATSSASATGTTGATSSSTSGGTATDTASTSGATTDPTGSTSSSGGATTTTTTSTSGGGPTCGNGLLEAGEDCDGADFGLGSCETWGFMPGGSLACTPSCTVDTSGCMAAASCGNGAIDAGEECDGANLMGQSCVSKGFLTGTLACSGACTLDTSGCSSVGNPLVKCSSTQWGFNEGAGWASNTITITDDVTITDVDVYIDVAHANMGGVQFQLTHGPVSNYDIFKGNNCINGYAYGDVTFDDEAASAAPGCPKDQPVALHDSVKPTSPLSALDGSSSAGAWTLRGQDTYIGDLAEVGTVYSWCVTISH